MTYNSYYGNAMNMSGSYCIHYGRKGMKWYQNIFEAPQDLVKSVRSSYRGASQAHKSTGSYASYGRTYGMSNTHARAVGSTSPSDRAGRRYAGYNRTISKVGNAVGVTAYNATVAARKVANKVGEIAKTAWNAIKQFGSKVVGKGRELLGSIFGWNKNPESASPSTHPQNPVDAANATAKGSAVGSGNNHELNLNSTTLGQANSSGIPIPKVNAVGDGTARSSSRAVNGHEIKIDQEVSASGNKTGLNIPKVNASGNSTPKGSAGLIGSSGSKLNLNSGILSGTTKSKSNIPNVSAKGNATAKGSAGVIGSAVRGRHIDPQFSRRYGFGGSNTFLDDINEARAVQNRDYGYKGRRVFGGKDAESWRERQRIANDKSGKRWLYNMGFYPNSVTTQHYTGGHVDSIGGINRGMAVVNISRNSASSTGKSATSNASHVNSPIGASKARTKPGIKYKSNASLIRGQVYVSPGHNITEADRARSAATRKKYYSDLAKSRPHNK